MKKWSSGQSTGRLGGVVSAITKPARSCKRWLSAALSGILHTAPTPAAVEAWNLTHYTYTCRGPQAAHRAVEFYTEALPTPIYSCFSPAGLEETEKNVCSAVLLQGFMTNKPLQLAFTLILLANHLCLFLHVCVFCS